MLKVFFNRILQKTEIEYQRFHRKNRFLHYARQRVKNILKIAVCSKKT